MTDRDVVIQNCLVGMLKYDYGLVRVVLKDQSTILFTRSSPKSKFLYELRFPDFKITSLAPISIEQIATKKRVYSVSLAKLLDIL